MSIGLLDRPITLGLFIGLITGNWSLVLGVAVFFELLWIDKFNAGTYIPPHKMIATFVTILLALDLELYRAGQVLPILFLTIPLAFLGSKLESWQRILQNRSYDKLLSWSKSNLDLFQPKHLIKNSLLQIFLMNSVLFLCSFVSIKYLYAYIRPFWPLYIEGFSWNYLWMVALLGGLLSLRKKSLYQYLILCGGLLCLGVWLAG